MSLRVTTCHYVSLRVTTCHYVTHYVSLRDSLRVTTCRYVTHYVKLHLHPYWQALIYYDGGRKYLGSYEDEEDARAAYDRKVQVGHVKEEYKEIWRPPLI